MAAADDGRHGAGARGEGILRGGSSAVAERVRRQPDGLARGGVRDRAGGRLGGAVGAHGLGAASPAGPRMADGHRIDGAPAARRPAAGRDDGERDVWRRPRQRPSAWSRRRRRPAARRGGRARERAARRRRGRRPRRGVRRAAQDPRRRARRGAPRRDGHAAQLAALHPARGEQRRPGHRGLRAERVRHLDDRAREHVAAPGGRGGVVHADDPGVARGRARPVGAQRRPWRTRGSRGSRRRWRRWEARWGRSSRATRPCATRPTARAAGGGRPRPATEPVPRITPARRRTAVAP